MRKCAEHTSGCLEEGTGTPSEYGLAKARMGTSDTIRRLALLLQPARQLRCSRPADPELPAQLIPADGPAGAGPVCLVCRASRHLQLVLGVPGLVLGPDCRLAGTDRRARYGRQYRYGLCPSVHNLRP